MKQRILSLLLVFTLLLAATEPAVYSHAASSGHTPEIGGYAFESAVYGKGLNGSQADLYPMAGKPNNYQYLTVNGVNTYTSLWITPEATLSIDNVGDAHCTYHCFASEKAYPVATALEHASYKTMDKVIRGDASFFPDITNQSFAIDFSAIPDKIILDDISVNAKIILGDNVHTACLPDDEIIQLTNAIKNRTRYTYDAGKNIFFTNLDIKVTGAYSNYTVYTLNANDGVTADKTLNVRYNHTLEHLPVPERTGYTFTGWFTSANGGKQILSSHVNNCEANQTLYAHWSPKSCAVTCIDKSINGRELGTTHSAADYDSTLYGSRFGASTAPNTYYKGYCYRSCSQQKVTTEGCTVYRYFTPLSVKVTLEPMGGNLLTKEFEAVYDSPLSLLCSPVRTGYQFNGWLDNHGTIIRSTDSSTFTEDTRLSAAWIPNTNTPYIVEIRQKNLAGIYETTASFQRYGTTDTMVSASPEDYSYEGFHYAPEDSLPSHNLNSDGSLLLHLNYERNTHRLTFDMNPGHAASCAGIRIPSTPAAIDTLYGETVLLPEPEEDMTGYQFGGWALKPAATQAVYDTGKTMHIEDKDYILYAVWLPREDTKYSVYRFQKEASGQYSLLAKETYRGRTGDIISYKDTQIPEGYYINHSVSRLSGQILPDGSLALVIKYDPISYEVSFHSAYDKKSKLLSHTYLHGEYVSLPGVSYTRTGYIQTGWTDTQTEEAVEDATPRFGLGERIAMESHDLYLYPTWKSVSPTPSASPAAPTAPDADSTPVPSVTPGTPQAGVLQTPAPKGTPSPTTSVPSATPSPVKPAKTGSIPLMLLQEGSVSLSAKKITLGIGEKYTLRLSGGKISSVTFSEKYVQVKQKNKRKIQIKTLKKGTTSLSIKTNSGENLTCKVKIKKAPGKIYSTKKQIRLKKGQRKQIHLKHSKGSACRSYRYSSNAPGIAAVSKSGQLTGKRKGVCRITITSYNKKKTHLKVQVR